MKSKILVLAIALFTLILSGAAVSAQQAGPAAGRPAAAQGRHCVAQAYQVPEGSDPAQLAVEAPAAEVPAAATCFPTFAQAIAAATGVSSGVDPNLKPSDVTDELLTSLAETAAAEVEPSAATATRVIGIHYTGSNYTGSSYTWIVWNSVGCNTGISYSYANLGGTWLNDTISSYRALGGCAATYHFEHAYFTGAVLRCDWCPRMHALDNRTSSLLWYRSTPHY